MTSAATEAIRCMAEHYLRLAEMSTDPQQRQMYVIYAATYADIVERSALREIAVDAELKRREPRRKLAPERRTRSHLRLVG